MAKGSVAKILTGTPRLFVHVTRKTGRLKDNPSNLLNKVLPELGCLPIRKLENQSTLFPSRKNLLNRVLLFRLVRKSLAFIPEKLNRRSGPDPFRHRKSRNSLKRLCVFIEGEGDNCSSYKYSVTNEPEILSDPVLVGLRLSCDSFFSPPAFSLRLWGACNPSRKAIFPSAAFLWELEG